MVPLKAPVISPALHTPMPWWRKVWLLIDTEPPIAIVPPGGTTVVPPPPPKPPPVHWKLLTVSVRCPPKPPPLIFTVPTLRLVHTVTAPAVMFNVAFARFVLLKLTVAPPARTPKPFIATVSPRVCVPPLQSSTPAPAVSKTPLLVPPPARLNRPSSTRTVPRLWNGTLLANSVTPVPALLIKRPLLVNTGGLPATGQYIRWSHVTVKLP